VSISHERLGWRHSTFAALLVLSARLATAQVYAINGTGVVAIDPNTGTVTTTGIASPSGGIYQGESASDFAGRRIFLLGSNGAPGQSVLTTISLASATLSQVNIPGTSFFIEYDPATQLLYGLQGSMVVAMNPSTGAVTPTGILWPGGGVYQGESASDIVGRRIFVLGSNGTPGQSVLTTISLGTGSATQVNVLGTSFFIEYDSATQLVYGLQGSTVVAINPTTGAVTPTSIAWPGGGVYQGESTADLVGRRIFILGSNGTPGQSVLTTISLASVTAAQANVAGTSYFLEFLIPAAEIPMLSPPLLLVLVAALALVAAIRGVHQANH
jgi:hypothetical protein